MDTTTYQQRLQQMRQELVRARVDGYLLPTTDAFLNEFTPPHAQRLPWLTGFTGSAGTVLVTQDAAAFFTDGRYLLQARDQLLPEFTIHNMVEFSIPDWLHEHRKDACKIGYDPRLFSIRRIVVMEALLEDSGVQMVPVMKNPVDKIWQEDRPPIPQDVVQIHPMQYAGESAHSKRSRVCEALREEGAEALLVTAPDSLAWLLNIRAQDVPHTPLALAHAILEVQDDVNEGVLTLFMEDTRVDADLRDHLGARATVVSPDRLPKALEKLATERHCLLLDPCFTPQLYSELCDDEGVQVMEEDDPIQLLKALKNPVEIAGTQAAHARDGVALVRFLHWLDTLQKPQNVTELDVVAKLREFRKASPLLVDDSFDTIAGFAAHGAIVHYRATEDTAIPLAGDGLLLVDSGGQYPDGTTDVTRTMAIGDPTDAQRQAYTHVLQGHIAMASATFPVGTTGSQLDVLARQWLWKVGMDYDHGTGHGVGSYLGVHEGPQRISKSGGGVALQPGMILSNEPGYYEEGAFGIRIENLVHVVERPDLSGARPFLGFETLTLAPFARPLMDVALLTPEEKDWINAYHQRVYTALAPELDTDVAEWLKLQTSAL
jgi:Xaa-Pro aminopeptidase